MLLKNGNSGKYLQYGLKILCCNPGIMDSNFGPGTQAAVEKFQDNFGLDVDGVVGNTTRVRLFNENENSSDESMLPMKTGDNGSHTKKN